MKGKGNGYGKIYNVDDEGGRTTRKVKKITD